MSRFVVASFLFLGWGFYEASGGADFEPPKGPSAALDVADAMFGQDDTPSRATPVTAESLVSKVALRVDSATSATKTERPLADPSLRKRVAMEQIAAVGNSFTDSDTAFSIGAASQADDQQATVQLASLSNGLSGLSDATPEAELITAAAVVDEIEAPKADIRSVTATRVNMRSGPGTVYPVLDQLTNGAEVQVIEDIGTGWLHLRTVEGGKVGWIAASLISKKGS
ncbi:SH3 domain-containing protein [Phaeobacter italicus]|uniref:SH3 domain-containing protein n=1 Tax=Phaeobacter italicus TaxID=481446 RepID=UPI00232C846C|nr:SH3 domain-containing protein [Phaeobacter italicus]